MLQGDQLLDHWLLLLPSCQTLLCRQSSAHSRRTSITSSGFLESSFCNVDAAFRSPCLGFSETFPWAFVFAGASLIMLLVVENTAKQAYIK